MVVGGQREGVVPTELTWARRPVLLQIASKMIKVFRLNARKLSIIRVFRLEVYILSYQSKLQEIRCIRCVDTNTATHSRCMVDWCMREAA